jgi:hypothetical protein
MPYENLLLEDDTPRFFTVAFDGEPKEKSGEHGVFWTLAFKEKGNAETIFTLPLNAGVQRQLRSLLGVSEDVEIKDVKFKRGDKFTMRLIARRGADGKAKPVTELTSGWGTSETAKTDEPPPPTDEHPTNGASRARSTLTIEQLAERMAECYWQVVSAFEHREMEVSAEDYQKMAVSVFIAANDLHVPFPQQDARIPVELASPNMVLFIRQLGEELHKQGRLSDGKFHDLLTVLDAGGLTERKAHEIREALIVRSLQEEVRQG